MENQVSETVAPTEEVVDNASVENTESSQEVQSILGSDESQSTEQATGQTEETVDSGDFISSVGEDYKLLITKKGFKSVDDVLKSYTNLEGMMGKKFDDLTNEELQQVYTKLGAPESPDGYEFEEAELPEGIQDNMTEWFASKAHELGISKKAAQELRKEFMAKQAEEFQSMIGSNQVAEADKVEGLKKEFGAAYEERIDAAKAALNEFGGEELKEMINKHGLNNEPALIKLLSKVGMATSEGTMSAEKSKGNGAFGVTPDEASEKIRQKFSDKAFMERWTKQSHPQHADAVREMNELYKLKNGVSGQA